MRENLVDYTTTARYEGRYDWFTNEIIDYVRNANSEEDAVYNLDKIMDEYKKRNKSKIVPFLKEVWKIVLIIITAWLILRGLGTLML